MRLAGKVAIVTGSTAGIGKGSAEMFAREGAKVVVSGRTVDAGEKVAEGIRAAGGEAIFVKADVSVTADVQRLVEETVSAYGKLDVLFNNAGIGTTGPHRRRVGGELGPLHDRQPQERLPGHKVRRPRDDQERRRLDSEQLLHVGDHGQPPMRRLICRFQDGIIGLTKKGGPRLCPTEDPGQLHLPGRYRICRAAQR